MRVWLDGLCLACKPEMHAQVQAQDLGERMRSALNLMFASGLKVGMIVGSDVPGLSTAVLEVTELVGPAPTYCTGHESHVFTRSMRIFHHR